MKGGQVRQSAPPLECGRFPPEPSHVRKPRGSRPNSQRPGPANPSAKVRNPTGAMARAFRGFKACRSSSESRRHFLPVRAGETLGRRFLSGRKAQGSRLGRLTQSPCVDPSMSAGRTLSGPTFKPTQRPTTKSTPTEIGTSKDFGDWTSMKWSRCSLMILQKCKRRLVQPGRRHSRRCTVRRDRELDVPADLDLTVSDQDQRGHLEWMTDRANLNLVLRQTPSDPISASSPLRGGRLRRRARHCYTG